MGIEIFLRDRFKPNENTYAIFKILTFRFTGDDLRKVVSEAANRNCKISYEKKLIDYEGIEPIRKKIGKWMNSLLSLVNKLNDRWKADNVYIFNFTFCRNIAKSDLNNCYSYADSKNI